MARIRKEYKMTEKNLEYIEEVKEKNNLKYNSEALDLIIREHRQNSNITTDDMSKVITKEVSEKIKSDIEEFKKEIDSNNKMFLKIIKELFKFLNIKIEMSIIDLLKSEY